MERLFTGKPCRGVQYALRPPFVFLTRNG